MTDVSEWVLWHEGYRDGSQLARRLAVVRDLIRAALELVPGERHPGDQRVRG